MTRARLYCLSSLGLLAVYGAGLLIAAGPGGFEAMEPFPLGGGGGAGGPLVRTAALALGLSLGWAVPGLSLALLHRPDLEGTALLGRAFGLGAGYLVSTGFVHALLFGGAPGRAALLALLALPPALLLSRRSPRPPGRLDAAALTAGLAMAALAAAFWPKLVHEGLNGDGTEAYELARSLEAHPLPRWDMERDEPPGRFGTPVFVPFWTGAYLASAQMSVLGRGEPAVRLPFVQNLVLAAVIAASLAERRGPGGWLYVGALGAVYAVWNAYWVGYEPPFTDLAEPAGTDALTVALWLAGFREIAAGSRTLGIGLFVLASGTTYSAPLLAALVLAALAVVAPERGRSALVWALGTAAVLVPAILLYGWLSGDLEDWTRQLRVAYWEDFVETGRRVPALPVAGRFLLLTGGLPVAAAFAWGRLRPSSRALLAAGGAYLVLVLAGSYKNLHYLMPLPWVLLAPSLDAAGAPMRLGATAVLGVVLGLSWPEPRHPHPENIDLGRLSCVEQMDYEEAALGAGAVYRAFDEPGRGRRFEVGRHTFVRYALDVDARPCRFRLARTRRQGWVTVAEGPPSISVRDLDTYVRWRFFRPPLPTSPLFPRTGAAPLPAAPAAWTGRIRLDGEPGRSLLLEGFEGGPAGAQTGGKARLLVPVLARGPGAIVLGAKEARRLRVRINDDAGHDLDAEADGRVRLPISAGAWQVGWNVLELVPAAPGPITLEWIDLPPVPSPPPTEVEHVGIRPEAPQGDGLHVEVQALEQGGHPLPRPQEDGR